MTITFADYTVKNIKTFIGMEGSGYNASLYRAGKRVAFVIDDASGGELMIEWLDTAGSRYTSFYRTYNGDLKARNMTFEEKIFNDLVNARPQQPCEYSDSGFSYDTEEIAIDNLVNDMLAMKRLSALLKKKALFTMKGKDGVFQKPMSSNIVAVLSTHPQVDTVFNTMPIEEVFKFARANRII